MRDYGRLSNRSLDEMIAGARVEVAPYKRDPTDFVLWKPSKAGEPAWPSPWGPGRPGWHIECSAMAGALLGETFDIHGGGIDLIFPHHENEIAQSRSAHGTPLMARYWLHNGFLQVEGEKMSKSLGNFVTIRDLLKGENGRPWPGETLKYNMLKTHYRQPLDWTSSRLRATAQELNNFAILVADSKGLADARARSDAGLPPTPSAELVEAVCDDLNTAELTSVLHGHFSRARSDRGEAARRLVEDCEFLGIMRPSKIGVFSSELSAIDGMKSSDLYEYDLRLKAAYANGDATKIEEERQSLAATERDFEFDHQGFLTFKRLGSTFDRAPIDERVEARAAARKAKNFGEADRIRGELDAMGIALKDSKDPKTGELVTTWEVKR
jgi:cysteinyl-tRNA synthetase